MSVLLQMAMFPTDKSESKSEQVSEVIKVIRDSGFPYKLTAMSTVIETDKMSESLAIVQKCYENNIAFKTLRIHNNNCFFNKLVSSRIIHKFFSRYERVVNFCITWCTPFTVSLPLQTVAHEILGAQ